MPLTEKQKKQLEKLDLTTGGGFFNFATNVNRAEMLDDKFLFIGLGGKGTKAVGAIKTGLYKKVKIEEGKDKPDNVEYLAIDTDKDELQEASARKMDNIGLDEMLETCQLFSSDAAGVLGGGQIPDYIERWKNPRLRAHLDGRGANGVRQASRFLLSFPDGFDSIRRAIESKITKLSSLNHGKGQLVVYVLAGISGGTGSGTFLDIPYIVRQICETNGFAVKVEGYIFLPDSYPVEAKASYLKYNAYAAMKELDFYMNIADRANTFFDATYAGGFTVHSHSNIFNTCSLITGSIQGQGRRAHPDQFSRQVVVDHIVNLVTKSEVNGEFLISSFLDNDETMIAGCVGTLPNVVPRDALYKYNVIGIGALTLPIEQVLSYIAKRSFDQIQETWNNSPASSDIDRMVQNLRVYPSVQFNDILAVSQVGLMTYQKKMISPSKEDVISGIAFTQIKSLWMSRNVELGISLDAACNQVLEDILNRFDHDIKEMFEDPDRGLFYTTEFLGHVAADSADVNGLLQRLTTDIYSEANGLIAGSRANQVNLKNMMMLTEGSLGKFSLGSILAGNKIEEYVQWAVSYVVEESKIDIFQRIQGKLDELIDHVRNKLKMYQSYADSFYGIKQVFESNFNCVMAGNVETQEYRVNMLDMSRKDEDTKRFQDYLDKLLDEGNYREMVVHLAQKIEANEKILLVEEDYNPMKLYTQFIEEEFKDIPNATIEKMIEIKYGRGGFNAGVKEIFDSLERSSKVIFDSLPLFPMSSMSSIGYISVPSKAVDLVDQITACANARGIKVAQSSDMNSIIWYNLICGVPLFAVSKIADYEKEYENPALPLGMHLSETGERDWGKFPNLFKQQLWSTCAYKNPRETAIIEEVRANADKMLEWGIIEESETVGGNIEYVGNRLTREVTDEDIETFMTEYCANSFNMDDNGIRTGAYLFQKFCDYIGSEKEEIFIATVYEEKSLAGLKRMLRLNWLVYLDLKKMLDIYPRLESAVVSKNRLGTFHSLYITEKIVEEDGFYLFKSASGKEVELLFVEDLHGVQHDHELYYVFENFQKMVSDDDITDIMFDVSEIKRDRSRISVLRGHKDEIAQICDQKLGDLNQARVQRQYEQAGQKKLCEDLISFYGRLKGLN